MRNKYTISVETATKLYEESSALNEGLIETCKFVQDNLLRLTLEENIRFSPLKFVEIVMGSIKEGNFREVRHNSCFKV